MSRFLKSLNTACRRSRFGFRHGYASPSPASEAVSSPSISQEDISRYAPGGYHPVRIGDVFGHGKYRVLSKLGYGKYSTVWMAHSALTKQFVALKILTADTYDGVYDSFELAILDCISQKARQDLQGGQHVLGHLDQFRHDGPHGQHVCVVFKPMGLDLEQLRFQFPQHRLPVPMAKKAARDMLKALAFLHDTCHVIHTDIKPNNILSESPEAAEVFQIATPETFLQATPALPPPQDFYMASVPLMILGEEMEEMSASTDLSFRLADFGTSSWTTRHLTEWIQPEKLRAPEVILGCSWDRKADIWNLGLVIWELATGRLCFDGQATATADYSSEVHLAQMQAILGGFPDTLLSRARHRDTFFDAEGHLTSGISFPASSLNKMCTESGAFGVLDDMHGFVEFILSTLALEPQKRPDARELLGVPWLRETA